MQRIFVYYNLETKKILIAMSEERSTWIAADVDEAVCTRFGLFRCDHLGFVIVQSVADESLPDALDRSPSVERLGLVR